MHGGQTFGLELRDDVESYRRLVRLWQERDSACMDIEWFLACGGEDWLVNGLMTSPTHGIQVDSIEERRARFGHNRRKRLRPPCRLRMTQPG